jgi:hypothetical protein
MDPIPKRALLRRQYPVPRAPIAQLVELRTFNWCIWAFVALASVGTFGVYPLLAASIGLIALAGTGRVWKCCGINCGIGWSAHSMASRGSLPWVHHRTPGARDSRGSRGGRSVQLNVPVLHATEAATVNYDTTPSAGMCRFARWCDGCQCSAWSRPRSGVALTGIAPPLSTI